MKPLLSVPDHLPCALWVAVIAIIAQLAMAQTPAIPGPLTIDGKLPTSGCMAIGSGVNSTDIADSPMLRELAEIAGLLDAKSLNRLRRSLGPSTTLDQDHSVVGTLHISRGRSTSRLTIARQLKGLVVIDPESAGECYLIDQAVFDALNLNHAFIDGIAKKDPARSIGSDRLVLQYFSSPLVLDAKTRRARFKHRYPELTRTLEDEQLRV